MDRKKARKKATELVSQMTLEEKQVSYAMTHLQSSGLASPPTTGGMKRSTELPAPDRPQFSRRQLDLAPLLTPNFWDKLQIPLLPKVVPNTMHIPRKKTVTFTKVLPSGRQT